jgi:NADP-dependent 3-hydroxy acid dehydrogenase YdfG
MIVQSQRVLAYSADVSDLKALGECINQAAKENDNKIDILIASAGETRPQRFDEVFFLKILFWICGSCYLK